MELMVISSPAFIDAESALINGLFDQGLGIFHLRKPGSDKLGYARLLKGILPEYRNRVALHQHHDLSQVFGTSRLHFPEQVRKEQSDQFFSDLSKDHILSTSVHDLAELYALEHFGYAFLGPVFSSYSKQGYMGIIQDDFQLQTIWSPAVKERRTKVVALGGIGTGNIEKVKKMGFEGAALLGWIWNEPQKAIGNFKQVQNWISENMS